MIVKYNVLYNAARFNTARMTWVATMMAACESTAKKLRISPKAIVSQAGLESGWGASAIGHNIFGIKADASWKGMRQSRNTREENRDGSSYYITADFRDYLSFEDCIKDHFDFLVKNSRYADAGLYNLPGSGDERDYAYFDMLQRAGYATANDYAKTLRGVHSLVTAAVTAMERVELPDGYTVAANGNIKSVPANDSTIVRDSNTGTKALTGAGILFGAERVITATTGVDWRVMAVIGVIVLGLGVFAIIKFSNVKEARRKLSSLGVL